jgi:hypothetical protein
LKTVKADHKEAIPILVEIEKLHKIEAEAREQGLTTLNARRAWASQGQAGVS